MLNEHQILACKKMQRNAQREVYEYLAPKLYATCKRYLKKEELVEEALADAFFTIFTKIDQLKEWKAFEGWAKKIAVNQCLQYLRQNVNFNLYLEETKIHPQTENYKEQELAEEEILNLLNYIPDGCKTIFNLYAIEGFGHKEIAQMLGISEGTSKSQLNVAKTKLQDLVTKLYYQKAE